MRRIPVQSDLHRRGIMNKNLPLIVYHAACRDGFCAAWVAKKAFGDIEAFPAQYGDVPPDATGRNVYILDFSYPRDVLLRMKEQATHLQVLDHHRTAEEALRGLDFCTFDMERSGAGLAWDVLCGGERPWIVNYVEDRDLWRKALPFTEEVNAYISTLPFDLKEWDEVYDDIEAMYVVVESGAAVLAKVAQYVREVKKNALRVEFMGYNVPCVNAPQVDISELLSALCEGEKFSIGWWRRSDGFFQYSLRTRDPDFDVSALAKQMGGGGHRGAAGFVSPTLLFYKS